MSIIANALKVGYVINHKNALYTVLSLEHVKPGKGGAFMQVGLRNVKTGTKLDHRFRSEEAVERVFSEKIDTFFLYETPDSIEVMNPSTSEQISVNKDILGDKTAFLEDGVNLILHKIENDIVDVIFPETMEYKVIETQPKMKGQTVTATNKPALLSNGITVQAPQFIVEGDVIKIKTSDRTYVSKA